MHGHEHVRPSPGNELSSGEGKDPIRRMTIKADRVHQFR